MKFIRNHLAFFSILIFLIFWITVLFFISPDRIVRIIGVENTYLTIFLIASIGGFSSFTAFSLYSLIATFIAGDARPWLIGLSAGLGITVGDTLIYYFGLKGRKLLSKKWRKKADKISHWIRGKPTYFIPLFIFFYAGFTPLPNDVMLLTVAFTGFQLKKGFAPLVSGNIIHMLLVALGISYGWRFFT